MGPPGAPRDWLANACRTAAGDAALVDDAGTTDFRTLAVRVEALAGRLAARRPASGTGGRPPLLALPSDQPSLLFTALHAAPRAGWALQPYDPREGEQRLAGLFARTRPEAVAGPARFGEALHWDLQAACADEPQPHPEGGRERPLGMDDVHLVVATSGTSGPPKAAMLTGRNLAAAAEGARQRLALESGDLWLDCLPLSRIGGLAIPYRCAAVAAGVLLHDGFDPGRVWRDLRRHGVSHLSVVPAMLDRLLECSGTAPPPTLRVVLVGGGPLSASLYRRALDAGWPVCPSFGMTETCGQVAAVCGAGDGWWPGRVGLPLPGTECTIVDPDANGVGRIRLRGPQVMVGYAGEEGTAFGLAPDGGFETGDLGRWDDKAGLTVVGRADEVLVTGGVNVHPVPVESVLADCPGVEAVAVTGRPDPVWGERLVAVYTGTATPDGLERWCRDRLPSAERPRLFQRVEVLPRGEGGKLDRVAVRRIVAG